MWFSNELSQFEKYLKITSKAKKAKNITWEYHPFFSYNKYAYEKTYDGNRLLLYHMFY